MGQRLVVAGGGHAGTEVAGAGASQGTQFRFTSMEEHLRRQVTAQDSPRRLLRAGLVLQSRTMDSSTDSEEHRHGAHG
jgi:hypothetical protein